MKNTKVKIGLLIVAALVIAMTISDWYYSGLDREYALLGNKMAIQGVVTHCKIHWQHAYISLDSDVKVHILPSRTDGDEPADFHNLVAVGDSLYTEATSDQITLVKNGRAYYFRNSLQ
jgi:hypothetical protein